MYEAIPKQNNFILFLFNAIAYNLIIIIISFNCYFYIYFNLKIDPPNVSHEYVNSLHIIIFNIPRYLVT